jgi:hypothetical protein
MTTMWAAWCSAAWIGAAAAPEPAPAPQAPAPEAAPTASSGPGPNGRATKRRWYAEDRPRFPRLVIAGGPMVGPHALGNQECRSEDRRCVTAGGFIGMGLQAEIRARMWKPLYVHARGLFAGNAAPKKNDPIYTGVWGVGAGVGAYGRRIFARGEYLFIDAFGKDTFTPPFHTAETGKDVWGRHAGLISVGFRQLLGERMAIELWGGPMIGPKSTRTIPPTPPERRILPTFLIGINVSGDVVR